MTGRRMTLKSETVTETELAVLQCLWERGELSIGEVAELLYEEVTDPKRASAQKLLDRLVSKGCVKRDRSSRPHRYRATLSRDEFAGHRVQALADRLYGGSMCPMLTSLVQSKGITRKDLAELRNIIDQITPTASAKRKVAKRKG
jgi:predicted transcriptional regulator